ncbi:DUF397 domain-containing protein [Streptomyces millisiae]|uniref:DUF397 domain-containing protein n=1 Tax=Streptomyces millisiae TaxID=3075542 RepID=A0ABU2LX26_9ACTN|nr:DUF397 domain-containing protein [Streptomyces sp. DSM 44918]MDT0321747.1 DUF397 domain-containing protein [Streptomyces sp. DSM 44918]
MSKTQWQKSSYSTEHGDCVELARSDNLFRIRESDAPHVTVATNGSRLRALLHEIKTGRLASRI